MPSECPPRFLASDNTSGICPEAMQYLMKANDSDDLAYGNDTWTARAADRFREMFDFDCDVFVVFNGTAANSLALSAMGRSYHSVICHELAHIETDECGGPEFFSNGAKLLTSPGANGKLTPDGIEALVTKRSVVDHRDRRRHHDRLAVGHRVDETGVDRVPDQLAAVEVDVAPGGDRHGFGDQFADVTAHCRRGRDRRVERTARRHQHGSVAVRPFDVEAADHVEGAPAHEHRPDLGEERGEGVGDFAIELEPVEFVVGAGDEAVERGGDEHAAAAGHRRDASQPDHKVSDTLWSLVSR